MTQNMESKPQIKRETKNKIRVEFERTALKDRLKAKYGSAYFFKRALWYIFRLLLLIGIAFVVLQPFYTMISNSIMAAQDFVDPTVVKVPKHLSMGIYRGIILDLHYFKFFFSTLGLSLACALLQMFTASLVGYGLAKFKFRGNKIVFFAVILTLTIPHGTMQSAIFYRFSYFDILGILKFFSGGARTGIAGLDNILSKINILPWPQGINMMNSIVPLIILSICGLAFKNGLYIFMLRQFFRGVPDELEESAYLDGANTFRTFWQIILPLSVPMMITIFLFAFCWQWTDDFYIRLFYISTDKPSFMTYLSDGLPSSLVSLNISYSEIAHSSSAYEMAMRYGAGMIICLPLIILYLFCQRFLVQGIERSGIVG